MHSYIYNVWEKGNKYDRLIIFAISLLSLGVVGGALQFIRLFSILTIPGNILYIVQNLRKKTIFWIWIFGAIWISYGVFSLSWCPNITNGQIELLYIFLQYNLIFTFIRFSLKANNPIPSIAIGWILCVCVTLLLATYELVTDHHYYTSIIQAEAADSGRRINGIENKRFAAALFNNYNEYVTFLSYSLPFVYMMFFHLHRIKQQLCLWFIFFLIAVIIAINGSRGGLLCVCITMVLLLWNYKNIRFKKKRIFTFFIFLLVLALFVNFHGLILSDIYERADNVQLLEDVGRIEIYYRAFELLIDSEFLGIGPWGHQQIYDLAPHNLWLEILCQYGLGVFIIFGCLLFLLFRRILRDSMVIGSEFFIILIVASIINSGYLHFPFIWVYIASIIVIYTKLPIHENFSKYSIS